MTSSPRPSAGQTAAIRRAFAAVLLVALSVSGSGCACLRNTVNANESLRWWLFSSFGASKICPEMLKRGVPLKLGALGPSSLGRFFPEQCEVRVDDATRTVAVRAAGSGYAMLPVTRRVGFGVQVIVEYRPDFRLEEDATYVWGRYNRLLAPPDIRLLGVENPVVNLATQTPLGNVATLLGQVVLESEMARGFTVVRQSDGDDFTLGILTPPAKPPRPFTSGSGRTVLAADVTTVGASSRDYLGPFEVPGSGEALFLHARVDGAPVLYGVVERSVGDLWRQPYQGAQPLGPPPANPLAVGTLGLGEMVQTVPVPKGQFYVVLENRAPPPSLAVPLPIPGSLPLVGEAVATVRYTVEVGERP